jgi:hypothetical protein
LVVEWEGAAPEEILSRSAQDHEHLDAGSYEN